MASLTGQTIASTYDALLKITDNGPITASLKQITDGLGNNTPLYLSATTVFVDGNFRVSGAFYDVNNNAGTAGQFLVSTGTGVDWQNISESNLISGTGTNGFISKFTAAGVIADSVIQESGSNIGIGILPTQKLHVDGNGLFTGTLTSSNLSGSNTGDETKASIESKLGAASSSNDGYLTAANWTTFNAKQNQLNGTGFVKVTGTTVSYDNSVYALASRAINTSAPLSGGGDLSANRTLSIARSNSVTDGYLAADDFASFNSRVPSTRTITINGDTQDLSANRTFNVNVGVTSFNTRTGAVVLGSGDVTTALGYTPANSSRIMTINGVGYNLSADRTWNVGTVTSINTSAPLTGGPITSSGTIGITQATTSTNGFLSSTDWNTFNNKQDALGFTPENTANKGAINGYASLDGAGKVPSTQLPSYVDDVVEVVNFAALPATGETGKIYITLDTNFVYRWSGSVYVKISEPNAVWGSITGTLSNQTDLQNALNAKQDTLTNPVTGTGTTNTLPKFTGASAIGNSNITDTGSLITLGSNTNVGTGALGIATTALTGYSIRTQKPVTGNVNSYGIASDGTVQSDVTSSASGFSSFSNTQATAFTLPTFTHYRSQQGTFGAGSTVTTQVGFNANSSLIGATNNYGFRGQIPSGTNRWNIFMDGTADNYLAGSLGIGQTALTGHSLRVGRNISGATTSFGVRSDGQVQSDVTGVAYYYDSSASTQATTFTLGNLTHYRAAQGTFGAGSTVTDQHGFLVASSLIGAGWNYGFRGQIPAGTNRWNIYMDGTANNYINGALGIGTTSLTGYNLRISKTITGAVTSYGIFTDSVIQSDVTSNAIGMQVGLGTAAATFTLTNLYQNYVQQGSFGAGSTVTNQSGYHVANNLTGATNNYGFRGQIASGTGRWNLYMDGTASNYIAGTLSIGNTTYTSRTNLELTKTITGNGTSFGLVNAGAIQSDVTTAAFYNVTLAATAAASFTLPILSHYDAQQGTFGAGSTVTTQVGFRVHPSVVGGTNNYAFQGQIPAGTGRWNLYMDGTANNYLAGNLGIGTTSPSFRLTTNFSAPTSFTNAAGDFVQMWQASGTNGLGVAMSTGDSVARLVTNNGYQLAITAGGTETARFTSSGNVGIGTTSPNEKLSVIGAISANNGMIVQGYSAAASGLNCEMGVISGYVQYNAYNRSTLAYGQFRLDGSTIALNAGSGGNVGIGTTSPSYRLHVVGSTYLNPATDYNVLFQNSGTTLRMNYLNDAGSANVSAAYRATDFAWQKGDGAETMRITSGGDIGIGSTNPAHKLQVVGSIASEHGQGTISMRAGTGLLEMHVRPNQGNNAYITFTENAVADRWSIGVSAGDSNFYFRYPYASSTSGASIATNGTYSTLSDVNKKKDFEASNIGLNEIMMLKPTLYRMKYDSDSEAKQLGFIAQEVKEVIPYAYTESGSGEDKFIGLTDRPIIAALVKAIQEQQAQIEELKAKLQ